jgi:membrane-bound lytic murein transglycosylase D
MTDFQNKMINFLKCVLMCFTVIIVSNLCGCNRANNTQNISKKQKMPAGNHKQLWNRIRDNYDMAPKQIETHQQPQIQKYVKHYKEKEKTLEKMSTQATPYLFHIVEKLEQREMPGELALLPMVESAFRPEATSNRGAAGLWQFIPSTGKYFGLKQNAWYDGRRDIRASTSAALDYLAFLHEAFDHNWMLALAAYNAGEGTVRRAIKKNLKQGKPTSFWDLHLPKETREYVPKFLALAEIIGQPEKHDILLPEIENKPYFLPVIFNKSLNFQQAANLANIHITELKRLNAGYKRSRIHTKASPEFLLPIANKAIFEYNFANKHKRAKSEHEH